MSHAYGDIFAKVYNKMWSGFALSVANKIIEYYKETEVYKNNKVILDLCCGTGQMAHEFLKEDFEVIGIDISSSMLNYAKENAKEFIKNKRAVFIQADASSFSLDTEVGLVISTFDSLNHLESKKALKGCFESVFNSLARDGYFIFDLNTRYGLKRWNSININDSDDIFLINRGIFDEEKNRAVMRITGFVKEINGLFIRFDEVIYNYVYDLNEVKDMLNEIGWGEVYFANINDLSNKIDEPEREGRIFIIARK
ncbi:MAG: class I SAM-dependent methyltransferase [Halanaerobiaceae bacterium]|nr:class I SAM-dependent methyltransferase [Halanaerobiaceae bacterium]